MSAKSGHQATQHTEAAIAYRAVNQLYQDGHITEYVRGLLLDAIQYSLDPREFPKEFGGVPTHELVFDTDNTEPNQE